MLELLADVLVAAPREDSVELSHRLVVGCKLLLEAVRPIVQLQSHRDRLLTVGNQRLELGLQVLDHLGLRLLRPGVLLLKIFKVRQVHHLCEPLVEVEVCKRILVEQLCRLGSLVLRH